VKKKDERPSAERKLGLFYSPSMQGDSGFLVPMNPSTVGPGEPGPEDEWHLPPAPEAGSPTAPAAGAEATKTRPRRRSR
jgi:hypothetical protein